MGKFIITEEEKSRIKGLYEQTTTGTTQQSQNKNHNDLVNRLRFEPKNFAEVKGKYQGMKPEYNRLYVKPNGQLSIYLITDDKVENGQILDYNTKTFGNSMKVSDIVNNPLLNSRR
jgi:hypothetical protein